MRPVGNGGQNAAMNRFTTVAGLVSLLLVGSTGCRTPSVDKQGHATSADFTVLTFAAVDPSDPALSYFVDAVDEQSGHRLRVDVDKVTYFSETPGSEARLAGDLQAGRIDFAYIPSRDWAATGDPGFRAVQSPFQITTTQASVTLARSQVAVDLLNGMERYDVVGLGMVPREPRRLITKTPLLTTADLKGTRIRISYSDQTASLLFALGVHPLAAMTAAQAHEALEGDGLDGVETAPVFIGDNSYYVRAPYLTSFALIPKFEIIAASTSAWAKLSAPDRSTLETAAAQTVANASEQLPHDESRELSELCAHGLVVVRPSTEALQELSDAASSAAPSDAPTQRALATIAAAVPGLGPQAEASPVPSSCHVATNAEQARTLHTSSQNGSPTSSAAVPEVSIPPGTYELTVTKEQMAAAGLNGRDWRADITFTWTIEADGTFLQTQQPDYPDQGPLAGNYVVSGDEVAITYAFTPTGTPGPVTLRWSFFQGTLTLSAVSVSDPADRLLYSLPWRKIA
jgi:TRAP-type C4-dicarboxylate transport system substrate-binding protein